MSDLKRTRQGKFNINDSYDLEKIKNGDYKILSINDVLKEKNSVIIDDKLFGFIKNGRILDNRYNKDIVTFVYNGDVVAIYKVYEKDKTKIKPFKMFI